MASLVICQSCGRQNDATARFCEDCAAGLQSDAEQYRAPQRLTQAPVQSVHVSRTLSPDERRNLLSQTVAQMAGQGFRVESQSDFVAVMVSGKRVNHLLHFFIGIFTLGFWWVVWIILALAGGERRQVVTVDEYGNVAVGRRTVG